MSGLTAEANRIIDYLVSVPKYGKTTVKKDVVENMLLGTDGWVTAHGRNWSIRSKHLGVGVHEVWLEERS